MATGASGTQFVSGQVNAIGQGSDSGRDMRVSMLNATQIRAMFEAKVETHKRGGDALPRADSGYQRAAMLEMSEMLTHAGVDVEADEATPYAHVSEGLLWMLHYILDEMLRSGPSIVDAAGAFEAAMLDDNGYIEFDAQRYVLSDLTPSQAVQLQLGMLAVGRFSIPLFGRVLAACGLEWDGMHRLFTAKTLLALFRLEHGFQSGRYVTMWNGRKDDAHLRELMDLIDPVSGDYLQKIYSALKLRYVDSLSAPKGS